MTIDADVFTNMLSFGAREGARDALRLFSYFCES